MLRTPGWNTHLQTCHDHFLSSIVGDVRERDTSRLPVRDQPKHRSAAEDSVRGHWSPSRRVLCHSKGRKRLLCHHYSSQTRFQFHSTTRLLSVNWHRPDAVQSRSGFWQ